jgi:SAM-dependent methyltransferase
VIIEGSVTRDIGAPPEMLWAMVTDVSRMGEWSPETSSARWIGPPGPTVGATFQGCNRLRWVGTWCSIATVTTCEPGRRFTFGVGRDPDRPNTVWSYMFESLGPDMTRVTESYRMVREPVAVRTYYRLIGRDRELAAGVAETLCRLQAAAEHPEGVRCPLPAPPSEPAPRRMQTRWGRTVGQRVFAWAYARCSPSTEARGGREHRIALLSGLEGRVVEVGCGNGLNFAHYPPSVTEVVAVEPDPYLRGRALAAAAACGVPIRVLEGHGEALPVDADSFDAAVVSLVLCSVPDPAATLAEISRVLRPAGQLRFYEHVASAADPLRRIQRQAGPWWERVAGGCRPDRDTETAITGAGFTIDEIRRMTYLPGPRFPLGLVAPHILGTARKRAV